MANEPVSCGGGTSTTSGTTLTVTNDTLIPSGSTVALVVSHGGSGHLSTVSGGSLVWQIDAAVDTSGFALGCGIASAYNGGSSIAISALSLTVTLTVSTTRKGWKLFYVPGIHPNRLDASHTDTDNPVISPSTPTITPSQVGETLLAAFAINSKLQSDAGWTAGSGWTKCGFEAPAAPSAQKTLAVEYRVVSDENTYTPSITLGTADAYAAAAVSYKIGVPDTTITPSVATSRPQLIDRLTTPQDAGDGVIYAHSHLDETATPQVFSRSLYLEKQAYLGRHVFAHHTTYNFSSYAGLGSDEAWLLTQSAWPISNVGGRITSAQTDFPGFTGVAGTGDTGLVAIAAGTYDTQITAWATALSTLGSIWVRPWREMNGNWTPWYTTTAAHYIAAWQRMAGIFHTTAPNVKLIWCPAFSGGGVTGTVDHTGMEYYPGDSYVDWVGLDGYRTSPNYYDEISLFTPIHAVFGPGGTGTEKPIIICETSTATTTGTTNSPDPVTWLGRIPLTMRALPGIRCIVFWEEDTHPLTLPEGAASDTDAEYLSIIQDAYLEPLVVLPQVLGASLPTVSAPDTPTITSPAADGTTSTTASVTVNWSAVTTGGTSPYTYQISHDGGATWSTPSGTRTDTHTYSNGLAAVRVRAVDAHSVAGAGALRTFTVSVPVAGVPGRVDWTGSNVGDITRDSTNTITPVLSGAS